MTIRAKLLAAIVLTVIGPVVTIGVALAAFGSLGDRSDEVAARRRAPGARARAEVRRHRHERLADRVRLRRRAQPAEVRGLGRAHAGAARAARARAARAARARAARPSWATAFDAFMALDAEAYEALQAGREAETRRILLGPEIRNFEAMARAADALAAERGPARGGRGARVRRRAHDGAARAGRGRHRRGRGDRPAAADRAGRRAARAGAPRASDARRHPHGRPAARPRGSPRACWPTCCACPRSCC